MRRPRRAAWIWLVTFAMSAAILISKWNHNDDWNHLRRRYSDGRDRIVAAGANTLAERIRMSDVLAWQEFIEAEPARPAHRSHYSSQRSGRLGAFRALPDTRDAACQTRAPWRLPPAHIARVSIIIAYNNEERSTIARTLTSLCTRSATAYLHELILIDDCSDDAQQLSALDALNITSRCAMTGASIRMQRNTRRLGLIASRNAGAQLATGDLLLFLDSHCEANVGWLEPLLERVGDGSDRVAVSPVLDIIDTQTLEYRASSSHLMGGFDWNLHFHWMRRRESKPVPTGHDLPPSDAFRSPTFSGGIFLISRSWFFKLNAFNTLLETWGGESIEFSIKMWLCGGQIEIVPCSRVGHIFRRHHQFAFPDGSDAHTTYLRNSKIIAESWLDAYKYFYYASKPLALSLAVNISRTELDSFKRALQCRPFAWYLEHVFPELRLPNDEFVAFGMLSNAELCLQIRNAADSGIARTRVHMASCYRTDVTHWYLRRQTGQLETASGVCLNVVAEPDRAPAQFAVVLQSCRRDAAHNQRWLRRGAQLIHATLRLCLDSPLNDVVAVSRCRSAASTQLFRFARELQQL